jgi:hypothetical protein
MTANAALPVRRRSPGTTYPHPSRLERGLRQLPVPVQAPLRRLKWMALSVSEALLARRERHYQESYRQINEQTNRLAARDPHQRDSYTWCALHAARLAAHLGVDRITVIEFGVAGGTGLVALEQAASWAESCYGIGVDVVGFDSGRGLGAATDARDLPNLWPPGWFAMDEDALRAQLDRAELFIGWIADTLPRFLAGDPAPIGMCVFDLDQYHATVDALTVLRAPLRQLLPRVHCLFDDVLGYSFGERNGERLAIREFNDVDATRWASPVFGLQHFVPLRCRNDPWVDKVFLAHLTDHPAYARYDGLAGIPDLPLT